VSKYWRFTICITRWSISWYFWIL